MGLKSSFMIAARSLLRRKTKNLSAILAVTLGVTLLVGIQITTDTLENAFLTSLLQRQGEVDFRVSNATGGYLTAADAETVAELVPNAAGIMPELTMQVPVMLGSQFDDSVTLAGVSTDYPAAFGSFYDWKTGDKLDLNSILASNVSVFLSSSQAEKLGLTEDTSLPVEFTTEFTNVTGTVVEAPTIPLSDWMVETSFNTTNYLLNSSSSLLSLELNESPMPGFIPGVAAIYTMNISQLSLADFDYLNVTATGTDNAQILLQFSLDDGSNFNVTNLEDTSLPVNVTTLSSLTFNLSPFAERTFRGDAFLAVISPDGSPASIEISEIALETSRPVISYSSKIERVNMQVVGIFDSKRPGIGSQYRGGVMRLEHLQQWMSLQDRQKVTDRVKAYLVALKTDHFASEINQDYLQQQVDIVEDAIPESVSNSTGITQKMYTVDSARLTFFSIAQIIMTLLSTMLTALGLLIMITGVLLITNVQLMNVEDREFQTGVLRAVGENRRGITLSMLIENMFQGILGGIFGLLGGLGFGQAVAVYLVGLFGTGEFSVQPIVSEQIVALSVLIGVALGIITGILPALRASRVNIVEALRGIKISFEEKSGRNLALLGIVAIAGGVFVLLVNGTIDQSYQGIWSTQGWNTLEEWRNILIGSGLLFSGIGMVLSRFISRVKALNFTAIAVWVAPVFLFVVAMGEWIPDISGLAPDILIIGVMEIMVGSVLLISVNLPPLMKALRTLLVKIRGVKGVGQIAPALISSHKTRSTLTFAIFAVILTLNVTVATLVPTNLSSVIETEQDSRGVDLIVTLNKPEANITGLSYVNELYKIDSHITDVIGFKTFRSTNPTDFMGYIALKDPQSPDFNTQTDLLPLGYGELASAQIRGNATDSFDSNWRYDFYLSSFPDSIYQPPTADVDDGQLNSMSKQAWDLFFSPSYKMPAYNVSLADLMSNDRDLNDIDFSSFSGYDGNELEGISTLQYENGSVIENPVVFTDSFILPLGLQVWIPMNTSESGFPVYQAFTIAGRLDSQRAGGFPLSPFNLLSGEEFNFMDALGKLYLNEYWANQTSYLAEADGVTATSRAPNQFNQFLIKTTYAMDDPHIPLIAQAVEDFTNTNDEGYRKLAEDNFYVASTTVLYSKIEQSLEMVNRVVSFLQIYVMFGLVIGAVGMAVISVRNVSERKREIGMMRAIGFPRTQVMLSVLLELVVLGIIGLAIGIANGILISVGFANMQGATLVIPWNVLGVYLGFITLIAIAAGAIPGWFASRIPPAEALRYVG